MTDGKTLQLVIYDLDGTLIDSVPDLCHALNAMLAELERPNVTAENVQLWVGNGSLKLVERALRSQAMGEDLLEKAHASFLKHYKAHLCNPSPLYAGVAPTLNHLHRLGISQAIATNKPQQFVPPLLKALAIDHTIQAIVGGNTYASKKPDALPLVALLERFQCPPEYALMIGDSRSDALSAKAAGIPCWLLAQGYSQGEDLQALNADAVFNDFKAMSSALLAKFKR